MTKIIRRIASMIGVLAVGGGLASCDDGDSQECCSLPGSSGALTYVVTACEGDSTVTTIFSDGSSYIYQLGYTLEGALWEDQRAYVLGAGGTCD